MADKAIAWMDVETTGIGSDDHHLLEIACLITDWDLNFLEDAGFQKEIYYSAADVVNLKAETVPYVLEMHTKTGLWDRLPNGTPVSEVDAGLLEYLREYIPESRTARLGGNSVSLDKDFINAYLPDVGDYLHYRILDVSSIAGLGVKWYHKQYRKKNTHSAYDDIRESIAELKFLRENIFK